MYFDKQDVELLLQNKLVNKLNHIEGENYTLFPLILHFIYLLNLIIGRLSINCVLTYSFIHNN